LHGSTFVERNKKTARIEPTLCRKSALANVELGSVKRNSGMPLMGIVNAFIDAHL
jgi:hypothetical protein